MKKREREREREREKDRKRGMREEDGKIREEYQPQIFSRPLAGEGANTAPMHRAQNNREGHPIRLWAMAADDDEAGSASVRVFGSHFLTYQTRTSLN